MKKFTFLARSACMLLAISILPFTSFSQHFTPVTNAGAGNWHFYPVTATLDGVALEEDDEIAIYDGGICVGARVLTGELDGSYSLAVANDWISYEKGAISGAGYTGGNSYTFRCYDKSADLEYIGTMTYNDDYGPQDYLGVTFPESMTFRWSWVDLDFTATAPTMGDLIGNITDGTDDIEGVSVTATGTNTYSTTTDADGDYTFDDIAVGGYVVTTSHTTYQDATANATVVDGQTTNQDFTLTLKPATFAGTVKDQSGTIVVGAFVSIATTPATTGNTDGTGAFSIADVPPGTYDVSASKANFATTIVEDVVFTAGATTTQAFVINSGGTLSGIISDGAAPLVGVTVNIVGTTETTTTAAGGTFAFLLTPGTYSIELIMAGYHTVTYAGFVVTAGNPTTVNKSIYAEHYATLMGDGNPYSDVWTIYLNSVTGDGAPLKVGDEVGIYTKENTGTNTTFAPSKGGTTLTFTGVDGDSPTTVNTGAAHLLNDGDHIEIYGNTNGTYDHADITITYVDATSFTIPIAFDLAISVDDGTWQDKKTTVTSAQNNLNDGDIITILGSDVGAYNIVDGIISNTETNSYDIDVPYEHVTPATTFGNWTDAADLVGYFALEAPISNSGSTYALKAFTDIYSGFGYTITDEYDFKLWQGGGSAERELTAGTGLDWLSGTGFTEPGVTFPAGSAYSMVDLDFDTPDGGLVPTITIDGGGVGAAVDDKLYLTLLKSDGTTQDETTYNVGITTNNDFSGNVPAGTYSLLVTGDRVINQTYTGIVITSGIDETPAYTITRNTAVAQTIDLTEGYNLASKRVHGDNQNMDVFIGTTAGVDVDPETSNIDFITNNLAQIKYFKGAVAGPDYPWITKDGYQFKMNDDQSIVIPASTPISYDAEITIPFGTTTMISYLPGYDLDASTAFHSLKNTDLVYIRDTDGNSFTNIGGAWVDHIGTCIPGEAYLIKYGGAANVTFTYPAETKSSNAVRELEPVHFPFYSGYGNPTNNIYTMYVSGDILEEGDEIAVFDGDKLVGAKVIQENTDEFTNNLVAFTEMFDREGYTPGNAVVLKLWKASEDKEYWLNYDITNTSGSDYSYTGTTYPSGDAKFTQAEVVMSPLSIIDNLAAYINVYPNPANGFVNISSPENIDRLVIVNLVGQAVVDMSIGTTSTQVNVENLNSGIYFINMIIDGQRITKKLTIQ